MTLSDIELLADNAVYSKSHCRTLALEIIDKAPSEILVMELTDLMNKAVLTADDVRESIEKIRKSEKERDETDKILRDMKPHSGF